MMHDGHGLAAPAQDPTIKAGQVWEPKPGYKTLSRRINQVGAGRVYCTTVGGRGTHDRWDVGVFLERFQPKVTQ